MPNPCLPSPPSSADCAWMQLSTWLQPCTLPNFLLKNHTVGFFRDLFIAPNSPFPCQLWVTQLQHRCHNPPHRFAAATHLGHPYIFAVTSHVLIKVIMPPP